MDRGQMSALGQKQTLEGLSGMSALPPKADMRPTVRNVRLVPKADIRMNSNANVGSEIGDLGIRHTAASSDAGK